MVDEFTLDPIQNYRNYQHRKRSDDCGKNATDKPAESREEKAITIRQQTARFNILSYIWLIGITSQHTPTDTGERPAVGDTAIGNRSKNQGKDHAN